MIEKVYKRNGLKESYQFVFRVFFFSFRFKMKKKARLIRWKTVGIVPMYLLRIMWSHFIYLAVLSNLGFGYALKCIISWYDYRCQGLLNRLRMMWYLVGFHFLWHTLACITHHSHFNRIRMLMVLWWQWWVSEQQQQKKSKHQWNDRDKTHRLHDGHCFAVYLIWYKYDWSLLKLYVWHTMKLNKKVSLHYFYMHLKP